MDPEKSSPSRGGGSRAGELEDTDPHQPAPIPPWVHASDDAEASLLPPASVTPTIVPNTRHYRPSLNHKRGRKWDHLRSAEPPMLSAPIHQHQARWTGFMESSPTPHNLEGSRVVDSAWVDENMPLEWDQDAIDKETSVAAAQAAGGKGWWIFSPERQEQTVRVFWKLLLKNPFVPLVFRLTVLAFAAAALGLSASIFHSIHTDYHGRVQSCAVRASTYMAIIIDTIALPYIGYVTWDEYFSKPLGLRSAAAKVLLLLCDVIFIIFASSNVSLAFDALTDPRWACFDREDNQLTTCPLNDGLCYKQRALSSVLIVSLFFWAMTFFVSVMRVVERLRV
ncbi:hypothetical protein K431DRAFT_321821 [Polychaeton citri CBS 116435]|uniref:Uncharacterized protein n=1 Tax=Polychaeton citri CBS 116435 TaxID=1314669 RepID=A0A9P4Q6J7_9PEZI|nr:hypothetical protein K431DRAFT_321821 [Polychaeton citri CBS 116435]